MNIVTYSPALALLFACALLWILMDVRFRELSPRQKWLVPLLIVLLAALNHLLRLWLGPPLYSKLLLLTLHLPTFLIFLRLTRCGCLKMSFMILSALVLTAPTVLLGNIVRRTLFVGSPLALLLSNLVGYGLVLLLAQVVFRRGFNYLLKYGDARIFLRLSLVPLLYYIYVFCATNLDLTAFSSPAGYIVRLFPTAQVLVFYFLLLYSYRDLSEKRELETARAAMNQQLDAARNQISLLEEAHAQQAVYRHDMRHQLIALEGLLAAGNTEQAETFIRQVRTDLEAITPKRFCGNELVNLLCSSFSSRAEHLVIRLNITARLPKDLSISDTELCALLSNGLENALRAVEPLEEARRQVELYCGTRRNQFLLEIKNPYEGQVILRDGLPVSRQAGHGYGCRSIQTITERHRGHYAFSAEEGIFMLRVVLPILPQPPV